MSVSISGQRTSGQEVRNGNVMAVQAVANVVRSSLGPNGLDKMLVDDIGDVIISNDGATILKTLEVQHPAAKVLVQLAQLQDKEVGDGTTSVVLLAAELLRRGNELVKSRIHPTIVMAGYRVAMKECLRYIKEDLSIKVDRLGREGLVNVAKTSMSSKLIGPECQLFAEMVVKAVECVKRTNTEGNTIVPVKAINVLKAHGQSIHDSLYVDGYVLGLSRSAQGMPTVVTDAKVACVDFNLNKFKLQMGVSIVVTDPTKLAGIRTNEMEITKERVRKILSAGANVILTSKGIDDLVLKYFVEAKAIAVRRVDRKDLRRVAKLTGAEVLTTLMDIEGEETFKASSLGSCERVYEERLGDNDYLFFTGAKNTTAQAIVLRGANEYMLDEVERSVHDAISAVKRVVESSSVVVGGGACETHLSIALDDFARTLGSKEQLAVAEFAESLLIIPKTLALNAAHDATELLAKMKMYHAASRGATEEKKQEFRWCGLDLLNGKVRNNLRAGVLEPAISKVKSLKFATEAAIAILRIDDLIEMAPKKYDDPRHQ
jgi:T-complex protein 1 subunit alpha